VVLRPKIHKIYRRQYSAGTNRAGRNKHRCSRHPSKTDRGGNQRRPLDRCLWDIRVYETHDTIASRDEAIQYALAELQAYAEKLRAGSFETYTSGLRSGQTITINLPSRGIADTFVIQAVTFSQISPTNYSYRVEIATTKTTGLVDILQRLLKDEQTVVGDDETLLNYFQLTDEFSATDEITGVTSTTSEDYVWEDTPEVGYPNPIIWDKFTWS